MLVISRRVGEAILIGQDICIRLASVRGAKVRIAVEAPGHRVLRDELADEPCDDGCLHAHAAGAMHIDHEGVSPDERAMLFAEAEGCVR